MPQNLLEKLLSAPLVTAAPSSTPILFLAAESAAQHLQTLSPAARTFAQAQDFDAGGSKVMPVPRADGTIEAVLVALGSRMPPDAFLPGKLPAILPPGTYRFEHWPGDETLAAIAFCLGAYRFTRYRSAKQSEVKLVAGAAVDAARVERIVEGVCLGRDLINTPANDLSPADLEAEVRKLAARHGAPMRSIVGEALLAENFPLVHAVGRAAAVPPRLVEFVAGDAGHPKITLVGKGVTFDTGGLDIKPSSAMLLMKKDMGGAATALGAAHMILAAKLPVRLRVIIPIVENAVAGAAFRPGDVLASRKGLSVEIGNTDAEGRLILADALALADEEEPDLILDFATLTGAARVALGPELPPFYTNDEPLAAAIAQAALGMHDPVWRMPLWPPYASMLDSKIADLNNVSSGGFAGSVTAALFLSRFVEKTRSWAHFDVYGWNPSTKPGRPEGGEAQVSRLVYALLEERHLRSGTNG